MGGKAPPTTTSTTKQELSPEQKKIFDLAMPSAEAYAQQPIEGYTGQTLAAPNTDQLAAQNMYTGAVSGINGLGGTAGQSQQFMLSTDQLNPNSNPYLSQMADQITAKNTSNLMENVLPKVRAGSIAAGSMYGGGSTRGQLAEGTAIGDMAAGNADALQQLYFNNYKMGIDNIARAQQLNPSVMSQQLFGADVLGAVGGQKQQFEQAFLTDQANRWNYDQHLPFYRAQELMSLVNGMPGGGNTSVNTGAVPTANPMMSALGGAASGASIGAIGGSPGMALGAILGAMAGYGSSKM